MIVIPLWLAIVVGILILNALGMAIGRLDDDDNNPSPHVVPIKDDFSRSLNIALSCNSDSIPVVRNPRNDAEISRLIKGLRR